MKSIYAALLGLALGLTACQGTKDYDNYVSDLRATAASVDTISSAVSYGETVSNLRKMANDFEMLGVKLDATQQDELKTLSLQIQDALARKYAQLLSTPQTLPADYPVEPDTTSTPVKPQVVRQ